MIEKLGFIGAGSMAESILTGILNSGFLQKEQIYITNKSDEERLAYLEKQYAINKTDDVRETVNGADIVVIAVKPYDLNAVIASINDYLSTDQLVFSVVAGVSTDNISQLLTKDVPVIRAMPNTSSAVRESATAVTRGKFASDKHLQMAMELFSTIGTATEVTEKDMHAVTAISGSGPAYIYYFVEAMEKAATEAGLDQQTARDLITQTIAGAGEMLKSSGSSAEELRHKVTSPGGTTQAGLQSLTDQSFQEMVQTCVNSARDRSIELGKKL